MGIAALTGLMNSKHEPPVRKTVNKLMSLDEDLKRRRLNSPGVTKVGNTTRPLGNSGIKDGCVDMERVKA